MSSANGNGREATRNGELRLRVLFSLPATHQRYLLEHIRKLCRDYLRNKGVHASELTPEELVSEVYLKLVGTMAVPSENAFIHPNPDDWSIDPQAPERDGRVAWLVEQIGGSEALRHRYEDILRERHGRSVLGRGRPIVQLGPDHEIEMDLEPVDDSTLQQADARDAWIGLLRTADLQFKRGDDVCTLLRMMADNPGLVEDWPGGQWPITNIVMSLNAHFHPAQWNADRVDNAKRRLLKWITRLMQRNGIDATDLRDLFARVGRQQESRTRVSLPELGYPNVTS